MAYGDNTLGANFVWAFNGSLVDSSGVETFTNSGTTFSGNAVSRDVSQALRTDARTEFADLTVTPLDSAGGTTQVGTLPAGGAMAVWFETNQIQGPPCNILYTGGGTAGNGFQIWAGNNIIYNFWDTSAGLQQQLYSDIALTNARPYHLCLKYSLAEGKFKAFLDGVEQQGASPDSAGYGPGGQEYLTTATGGIRIGDADETLEPPFGGQTIILRAPTNMDLNNLWMWGPSTVPSDSDIRRVAFEEGAIPDTIITSGTPAAMQTQLDALADTVRPDWPLAIQVNAVTGDSDLSLVADNVTFDPRASIHVRYEGAGTLSWTNNNGSDASIGSGNVNFLNPFTLTLTDIQNPTEVRVYEAGTTNEVAGQEDVTTGTFAATISVPSVDIRFVSLDFRIFTLYGVAITSDVTISVQQFVDRVYENP